MLGTTTGSQQRVHPERIIAASSSGGNLTPICGAPTGHMIDQNRTTVKTKLKRKICKFDMVCTNYLCMRYSVSTKSV